jgi:hypothetical protein
MNKLDASLFVGANLLLITKARETVVALQSRSIMDNVMCKLSLLLILYLVLRIFLLFPPSIKIKLTFLNSKLFSTNVPHSVQNMAVVTGALAW